MVNDSSGVDLSGSNRDTQRWDIKQVGLTSPFGYEKKRILPWAAD